MNSSATGSRRVIGTSLTTWPGTFDSNVLWGTDWSSGTYDVFNIGSVMYTLAEWQAVEGNGTHNVIADPALNDGLLLPSDVAPITFVPWSMREDERFAPTSEAPLKDAGTQVGAALDFYGRFRDASPDIGAVELVP